MSLSITGKYVVLYFCMMIAIVIFEIKLIKSGIPISDLYLADSDYLNMNSAGDAIIFFNFNASDSETYFQFYRIEQGNIFCSLTVSTPYIV